MVQKIDNETIDYFRREEDYLKYEESLKYENLIKF